MKTTTLTLTLLTALLFLREGSAATPKGSSEHRMTFVHRHHATASDRRAEELQPELSGVIPRAVRSGDPLEMLDPLAPAKYGSAPESTLLDPDGSGQWDGIKLLTFSF
ncbi:MAG: hypothetical protein ACREIF_03865 [Chthoniobacterales bacterium]